MSSADRTRAGAVHAVIIGGGGTGAATAHDLALRGFRVTLIERGELTSGTTGRHHGQLHSGARYAVRDPAIGRECMQETTVLRRIASESIEMNYGLFVALDDADVEYADMFQRRCEEAGIPRRRLSVGEALRHEPALNPNARLVELVPDGTLDAYRLPLQFFATASSNGARIRPFTEALSVETTAGQVVAVVAADRRTGREERIVADVVVSAAGPWAGIVAQRAGVHIDVTPAPGTMVAVKGRLCNMVVSHMHPPSDGDIIVPQRRLSIIGSTQWETNNPDDIETPERDVSWLLRRADDLVPGFSGHDYHASWTAVRPLAGVAHGGGRMLSRDFQVVSHESDGAKRFYSAIGGKATVLRAMAERLSDTVCADLGLRIPCATADSTLLSHRHFFRERRPA